MTEFKNLKVPSQTHEKLVSRANALGVKKFVLADALLQVGLQMDDTAIQAAVVAAQRVTQPTASTSAALPPEQP